MARRKTKRKHQKQTHKVQSTAVISAATDFTALESAIRDLLAQGKAREAVRQAKEAHKQFDTEQSEDLLASAYQARIKEMSERGMEQESASLLDLVTGRHPRNADVWKALKLEQDMQTGNYDDLVRPLSNPDLHSEQRQEIETRIKQELFDLNSLAETRALVDGHPLRVAAAALNKAFKAVTTAPVDDSEIALPEVSRRSPLAPWKLIIRAISHFYRGEDEPCLQALDLVDPSSAPARLIGPLKNMIGEKAEAGAAVGKLQAAVSGSHTPLHSAFEKLDEAFSGQNMHSTVRLMVQAEKVCKRHRPELLQQVVQLMIARGFAEGFGRSSMERLLSTNLVKNAVFLRLMARVCEHEQDEPPANEIWDEFRRAALREGLIKSNSPEEAAVYLHMGSIIQGASEPYLVNARRFYIEQDGHSPYFLDVGDLHRRACTIDPQPDSYSQWLDAVRDRDWHVSDEAAQAWHGAFPQDSRPLLFLMHACEQRKAFKKAIQYLELAEAAEAMNPDVRRARLRLWFSTSERHLEQKKPHLARKDFEEIEKLTQLEGDRGAYLNALRRICFVLENDSQEADRISDELEAQYGNAFRYILCGTAADTCKLKCVNAEPTVAPPICDQITRAFRLTTDLERQLLEIPHSMEKAILQELQQDNCVLDSASLFLLGETILDISLYFESEIAFHASLHGLRRRDEFQACFMLLRAHSWYFTFHSRGAECAAAAVLMARRRRDTTLAGKAVDLLKSLCRNEGIGFEEALEEAEQNLNHILEREIDADQFPNYEPYTPRKASFEPDDVDEEDPEPLQPDARTEEPPKGRAAHQALLPFFDQDNFYPEEGEEEEEDAPKANEDDDSDEDDDWDDDDPEGEEFGAYKAAIEQMVKNFHPKLAELFLEMFTNYGDAEPEEVKTLDPDLFNRLQTAITKYGMPPPYDFEEDSSFPGRRNSNRNKRRKRRKRKRR